MLDYTEQRRIIEKTISEGFDTCPVIYENLQPPGDGVVNWISVVDKATISESTGMGEVSYVTGGTIIIAIFSPKGGGTKTARAIAQEISDLLGTKDLDGIATQEPEFHGNPGQSMESPWYQMNLIIPYSAVMGQDYSGC